MSAWAQRYEQLAVRGVRSPEVANRIALHLLRFERYLRSSYGHDRLSTVVARDVTGWRDSQVAAGLAPATVNNHLASLSGFLAWVGAQAPEALPGGDPSRRVGSVGLAPLEPRALTAAQVRSLKSVIDRLERFHQLKGRRSATNGDLHGHGRPVRDRAVVYTLLSTGLRREELTNLDVGQLSPADPAALRAAKRARLTKVRGKGGSQRSVFLSADARSALADYLEHERPHDVDADSTALFVSASSVRSRRSGGRLSPRAINLILERIGAWHDAEQIEPDRRISPLRPHDIRHTFAFSLSEATGADAYELERRLGHRSQRYIARYTNPPEEVAAGYVEAL